MFLIVGMACVGAVGAAQVRLVIWKCKDVVSMDFASGLNDLFVKAWLEGCEPQVSTTLQPVYGTIYTRKCYLAGRTMELRYIVRSTGVRFSCRSVDHSFCFQYIIC